MSKKFESAEAFQQTLAEAQAADETPVTGEGGGLGMPEREEQPEPTPQPEEITPDDVEEIQEEHEEEEAPLVEDDVDTKIAIPKKRFDQESQKRKEAEEAARAAIAQTQMLQEAINTYLLKPKEEAKPEEESVDYNPIDEDADKAYRKELKELREEVLRLKQGTQQIATDTVGQRIQQAIVSDDQRFYATNKDYPDAVTYFKSIKAEEARMLGANEQQAQDAANQAAGIIATNALNQGKSSAEAIYALAQKFGYKKNQQRNPGGTPNLDAIADNMKKSSGSKVPTTKLGLDTSSSQDLISRMRDPKTKRVDPKEFAAHLQRLQSN